MIFSPEGVKQQQLHLGHLDEQKLNKVKTGNFVR